MTNYQKEIINRAIFHINEYAQANIRMAAKTDQFSQYLCESFRKDAELDQQLIKELQTLLTDNNERELNKDLQSLLSDNEK